MDWLQAPDQWLARFLFQRLLGAIYLVAFLVTVNQFPALLGERGLLPAPDFLRRVRFRWAPSLFHLIGYSDRRLLAVGWTGVILAGATAIGLTELGPPWLGLPVWLVLWALYLSVVNVGQTFYAFGWESLLLEAGFLAAFLGSGPTVPPAPVIWLLRWLLFRVEFGAGLIKMRGDRCWRDLTCLDYHHETQPMPNPLSWYFHHLPRPLHRVEAVGNHFAQLVVPFGLFAPQPVATVAGAVIVLTQGWLVLSGNFSWLNLLTIALAVTAFDDAALGHLLPFRPSALAPLPLWWQGTVAALTLLVAVLSWWPIRNLLSRHQLMNYSFNPLHLVNAYGAFGSVTRERFEIVIEGTASAEPGPSAEWREYEFKGKPGDPRRRPPQVAPYHLRLDWLMWFAALSPPRAEPWLVPLMARLLTGDRATLKLLRRNPFPDAPPAVVRARRFRYRFTTWAERRETGAWWVRWPVAVHLPPMRLEE
ncbi:MAG TPA: lipase maturation factor family protein [Candidatus Dormibacteraeota bacterium]|nr:lipase maturation factor family protein [Candidatus Dormibacteraeota bacterium]